MSEQNLEQLVRNFYAALNAMDAERTLAFFAEDGRYEDRSMGWDMDREQVRALVESMAATQASGSRVFRIEPVSVAVKDNLVLTERLDHFESATGHLAVPVASAIEFEDGKIRHMREYWDRATSKLPPPLGLPQPDATARANKAVVDRVFDEVWTGNIDLIDEICGEDFVYHGAGAYAEIRGTDHTKTALAGVRAAFPDLKIVVDQVIAEGDRVVQRYTFSGTHTGEGYGGLAPTGKQITAKGIIISRVSGGKVVEQWESYDHLGMMKQMGLIPAAGEEPARADSSEANKALVDRVFDEVYNNGNLDVIEQLFSADFVLHMPGREVRGPDGVRDMVTVTRNGFPDIHFALEDAFAAGDRVVHRYTITGTHLADWHALPKTGKQVSGIQGYCVSRLVGGKVVEMWELDDSLSMLQQLGLVTLSAPMPSS